MIQQVNNTSGCTFTPFPTSVHEPEQPHHHFITSVVLVSFSQYILVTCLTQVPDRARLQFKQDARKCLEVVSIIGACQCVTDLCLAVKQVAERDSTGKRRMPFSTPRHYDKSCAVLFATKF